MENLKEVQKGEGLSEVAHARMSAGGYQKPIIQDLTSGEHFGCWIKTGISPVNGVTDNVYPFYKLEAFTGFGGRLDLNILQFGDNEFMITGESYVDPYISGGVDNYNCFRLKDNKLEILLPNAWGAVNVFRIYEVSDPDVNLIESVDYGEFWAQITDADGWEQFHATHFSVNVAEQATKARGLELPAGDSVASSAYYEVRVTTQEEFDAAVAAVGTHPGLLDRIVCDTQAVAASFTINQTIDTYLEIDIVSDPMSTLRYSPTVISQGTLVLSSVRTNIINIMSLKVRFLKIIKGHFGIMKGEVTNLWVIDSLFVFGALSRVDSLMALNSRVRKVASTSIPAFMSLNSLLSGEDFSSYSRQVEFSKTANGYVPALPEDFVSQDTTPKLLGGGGWVSVDQAMGKNSVLVVDALPSDLTGLKDGDIIIKTA